MNSSTSILSEKKEALPHFILQITKLPGCQITQSQITNRR